MDIQDLTKYAVVSIPLKHLGSLRKNLNGWLLYEPIVLIGATAIASHVIHDLMARTPNEGPWEGVKRYFFKIARKIPYVRREVEKELSKNEEEIGNNTAELYCSEDGEIHYLLNLPSVGYTKDEIFKKLEEYGSLGHYTWDKGSVSGAVYHGGKELTELNTRVFEMATWSNPLHPDIFPGVCKMEAEVVRMMANIFGGGPDACGTITSGGTESILLAVKAYRDWAREERGIIHPEMIVPRTVHAAFAKASLCFNVRIKYCKVDEETFKVNVKDMKRKITKNTIMLVGSAPNYPYGVIDDIESIAKLGKSYGIPVHTDACLGGFLLAFMPKAGFQVPPFDFNLSGITSISADPHKYGYTPKGASLLLFREKKFKRYQYFMESNWPGGIYASPTMAGSRPGVVIATCWASMVYFGMNGYVDATRKIVLTARKIEERIRQMPELKIFGSPMMSVVGFTSEVFDVYRLSDALSAKGWVLNNLQFPPGIHFCLTYCHTEPGVAENFLIDLEDSVVEIMKNPGEICTGAAAVYGMAQKIPDRSLVGEVAAMFLDSLYRIDLKPNKNSKKNGNPYH